MWETLRGGVVYLECVTRVCVSVSLCVCVSAAERCGQQDEFGRRREACEGGLSGGGHRERSAWDRGLHRRHPVRLGEMGGGHPGRTQGEERRHGAGKTLLHLRGESWDIRQTVSGKKQTFMSIKSSHK